MYSGLTLNQDKATKPQTVQRVRQGEATPYWFKVNPLYSGNSYYEQYETVLTYIKKSRLKTWKTSFQTTFKGKYLMVIPVHTG